MEKKIRVGFVYGGKSGEHNVSLQTAYAVMQQIDYAKYDVLPFYISKQGEWQKGTFLEGPPQSIEEIIVESDSILPDTAPDGEETASNAALATVFVNSSISQGKRRSEVDVFFPLLHGTNGEDGTIQGLFEMANVPYVGSGVLASAIGMDKVIMKKIYAEAGLAQCKFHYFYRFQWSKDPDYFIKEVEKEIGYPCFVKPANLGSSVGISKASNRDQFTDAVNRAFQYDRKVIVEEFVDAREIEVSVLGNEEPIASVPGEIVSSHDFYDYTAKYIDGSSAMIIPAKISPQIANQIREMAVKAYQAIEASGLARVDFFLRKQDQAILINEINTMPGFTPHSMYPLLWKASGKSYTELLDDLIKLALRRYEDKQHIQYVYDE